MKLSIITVNYNNLVGLVKTCESVKSQSYRDFEWLVIDGGSTDGAKEYLETLSPQPDYWCSEPDKGIYHAMNKGIGRAQGEYLLFLNSGDTLLDNHVLADAAPLMADTDIVYGNAVFCKTKKSRLVCYPESFTLYHLWKGLTPCHQATFIKASLLKEDGGYDERYKIVADYKKWIEWKLAGKTFRHINITICNYMLNGISTTNRNLHQHEHDAVVKELLTPQLKELIDYTHWLNTTKSRREKEKFEGKTTVITPFYLICWRTLYSLFPAGDR